LFCACEVCRRSRKLGGKNLRSRSSALINGELKVDLPPDTLHHVLTQGLDLTEIKYLVFTHAHDDHLAARELQYMSSIFVPAPITAPLAVFGPCDVIDRIGSLPELDSLPLGICCLRPWKTLLVDSYSITPILAQHDPGQTCFNYLLSDGEKTLLYATDTGW